MSEVEAYSRLAGVYDEIVVDPCFADWADFLVDLWGRDQDGVSEVLDVCCGTGLLAAELIRRGCRVTGVDASDAMLARARRLLGPDVRLQREVLPDLQLEGIFDAAVSTFDGLNYLELDDFRASLTAIGRRLRPGGWLVFDLHTQAMLELALGMPTIRSEQEGTAYVIHNAVDLRERTCDATITVTPADGDPFVEHHRQYVHADQEVRSALADAGLDLVSVTDEYTHLPVAQHTLRATWTARRPAG